MDKQEASCLLKELLTECRLDANSFILMDPARSDPATGYKIRIKTTVDSECRQQLKRLTKKHNLAVIEESAEIIIYKPPTDHAGKLILK